MYFCTIVVDNPKDIIHLEELFKAEKTLENDRATWVMQKKDKSIVFEITAKDAVALRACANGIMKTLAVYEKARNI
jgi:tRNA threonylcarbamoyladenosine modification (KEOPS) complex  Pcc1 subunit